MSEQRAIIDIGSNTVRLVIYNGPPRAPIVLHNEKVTARLGKDVSKGGMLSDKAVDYALAALRRYELLLRLRGIDNVDCVATAAVRDASNGGEFLASVKALGLSPRLLSGEEEACTSAMGVIAAFPDAQGVVGDLGGGSLELVAIECGACEDAVSFPFGTLRLPELRSGGPVDFAARVRRGLGSARWKHGEGRPFFIVGGSWRALALHAMWETGWPLDDQHDFELAPQDASRICAGLTRGKIGKTDPRIAAGRLGSLPDAAALLGVLVEELRPSRIVFSAWGLREGLLYCQLDETTRAMDPMLAGVAAFAEDARVSLPTARDVAGWTCTAVPDRDDRDAALRLAGTMLALASMRSEPNMRAEQAMNWALRKRWIGLDARGRAMLAMTVLANTGDTDIPRPLAPLASTEDFRQAIAWGLAVRLCRKLTGCSDEAIAHTALTRQEGKVRLELHGSMRALLGNSAAKNLRVLAEWLGLEPSVANPPEAGKAA